jgi:hypothetical protein
MINKLPVLIAALALALFANGAPPVVADDDGARAGRGFSGGGRGFSRGIRLAPRFLRGLRFGKRSGRRRAVAQRRPAGVVRRSQGREIVVVGLAERDLDRLTSLGFTGLGTRPTASFNATLTRLRIPDSTSVARALAIVGREAPGTTAAPNERYGTLSRQVYEPSGATCGARCEAFELTAWTDTVAQCTVDARIGVVDTAADLSHPSLAGAKIKSKVVRGADREPSDALHGTAVLSLLAGQPVSDVVGVAHRARIFHVDAFHGQGDDSRTDVFDLVSAIDWLISLDVQVLNLSLSGPDNAILHRAIVAAQNKGIHVVAAAGKPDGFKSAGYPARYDGVVAVAAVDARLRPSRLSLRGKHVAFAAPGVGLMVAHGADGLRRVDGTSFATPFVTAAFAMSGGSSQSDTTIITRDLATAAQDLGATGRDPIYGWGLIRYGS